MEYLETLIDEIQRLPEYEIYGHVTSIQGLTIEASGIEQIVTIGSHCYIETRHNTKIDAEVVGFKGKNTLLIPFSELRGIGLGCRVVAMGESSVIYPDESWLGRVLNAMANPIDSDTSILPKGKTAYPLRSSPPLPHTRKRVGEKFDMGVRAINSFLTCCRGQRLGIFAGSGVGKSTLISMLTRHSEADVKVIGLIGERGREVQEFIQDYLGPEGMKTAVVVTATSDESAVMRRQSAFTTMAIAEYFRDQGKNVLCLMDSVTRFAMAQREIGLSAGEPPTTKGYTPTVFSELPKLLERAGPGATECKGDITGLFTVLVDGDDHNEPISDAVRGILDGHVVLDRSIAERGRYPSINILRSVSRMMPKCNTAAETALVQQARTYMSSYEDMAEMIRLGAYKKGSDKTIDEAITFHPRLETFLNQSTEDKITLEESYQQLAETLNISDWQNTDVP